ncbi:hypothetical protein MAR_ORF252 [Marseillevirus marseillevirus]|uniref:Uncharacterized protein n=1 Tax=Marseillevirus marseillevirus TaxID=694581 RepID=D2XAQ0_GBMV|nr:hypothetical protein MAR_ORF252 [Marseillevirus marseillevirus]ADB04027.1 hypothetical protein MAR_ORF252 [Marseillevirus marseillevirus]
MSQRPFVRSGQMFSGRRGDAPCPLPEGSSPVRDCGCIGEGTLCFAYDVLSRSRFMMTFYESVDLLAWEQKCKSEWAKGKTANK